MPSHGTFGVTDRNEIILEENYSTYACETATTRL